MIQYSHINYHDQSHKLSKLKIQMKEQDQFSIHNKAKQYEALPAILLNQKTIFCCFVCGEIPNVPFITCCCEQIICKNPCSSSIRVHCQKQLTIKQSIVVKNLFENMIVQCSQNCGKEYSLLQKQRHNEICPNKIVKCKLCPEKVRIKDLIGHADKVHREECNNFLIQMHNKENLIRKRSKALESKLQESLVPVVHIFPKKNQPLQLVNIANKLNQFAVSNCGKKRESHMFSSHNSSSIFKAGSSIQNQYCTAAANCNQCMDFDRKRFGLPPNILFNNAGRLCLYNAKSQTVSCGTQFRNGVYLVFCKPIQKNNDPRGSLFLFQSNVCQYCTKLKDMIKSGSYRSALGE